MKRRVGNFVAAVFVAVSLGTVIAQTTMPCPEYCMQKYLEATYGDDWHLYYLMFGCFLLPENCTSGANAMRGLPTQAMVRFR